ncbi:hypothetical protein MHBO_003305, partial [Bonamia ostreae]
CYSIVHGSTREVPRLNCRTCSARFHSACLFKWFARKGEQECPMCRSNFFVKRE